MRKQPVNSEQLKTISSVNRNRNRFVKNYITIVSTIRNIIGIQLTIIIIIIIKNAAVKGSTTAGLNVNSGEE